MELRSRAAEKNRQPKTTVFQQLSDLTGSVTSKKIINLLSKTFNIGQVAVVKTTRQNIMLGDFTLVFNRGSQLKNRGPIETYADLTGMLLGRIDNEKKVIKEQARLKTITDNMTDLVWETDLKFNFTYTSPSVERILGFSVEEHLQLTLEERFTPESLQIMLPLLQEELEKENDPLVSKSRSRLVELEHYKKDGSIVLQELNISFIRDNNGKPVGMSGVSRDITERKRAEEKLKESNNLFAKFIAYSPIYTYIKEVTPTESRVLQASENFFQMIGIAGSDMIGKTMKELFPAELAAKIIADDWACVSGNKVLNLYEELNGRSYTTIKFPLHHHDRTLLSGYTIDITDRKQAEEVLSNLIENNPMSIQIMDKDGFTLKVNPAHSLLFGVPPPPDFSIFTDLQNKGFGEYILRAKKGEVVHFPDICYNVHSVLPELPDKPVWVRAILFPLMSSGILEKFVFIHEDVTDRKQVEDELRNLSEMQSIILRIASEYINMPQELVDKSINNSLKELGEFVRADRAYVFEYDWIKNVCNNTYEWCYEGISPEIDNLQNVPNDAIDYWVEAHKNGKEMNIEDVMQLPPDDGVRRILEPQEVKSLLALPMMNQDKCIGFIGFDSVRKIHKYSEKEKTLLKIFAEMLVNIGNRKELEKNLVQSKEKAEESDRLKSAFLSNMSHEIRTPMNGILGFADLLKAPDLSGEQQHEYINIIEKSGARMLNIINDIIDISKIEAGLMKLDMKESNINEQIEYIYTFFKPEAETVGIKLSFRNTLPAKEAIIQTDREKLYAILTNLVKNAIKFTHKGSIELGYNVLETGHALFLHFYVKDTGIGIPKDRQEAIFERFIQADIADKMVYQGAGLGLAISKAYVEMLGGKIWVESEEGKGSIFYFTLPYNVHPAIKPLDLRLPASEKSDDVRKLKILIVEDDEVSELLIVSYIKMFVKEILTARTGIEAVETYHNNPDIDLILMDIRMPGMGGHEATRQIRELNKEVIIIAQTAYGLTGDREKLIDAGCNDYIAKPIKKIELQALIQKYFGN